MPFSIRRGTNISEWLSQSGRRGIERAAFFTGEDARRIARLGFDHIRLPVDEEQLWDEQGRPEPEAFSLLDAALDWCEQYGLRVVLDLHILRSHYFNQATEPALFSDPAEADRFVELWEALSAHLARRSPDFLAYELLNEPVARDPADWNRVALQAFAALRRREPARTLVLGSNHFNQVQTFDDLAIPADPHCILTFHYYRPMLVTHYRASWWPGGRYTGPVRYPGQVVAEEDLAAYPPEFRDLLRQESGGVWDRARIEAEFARPLAAARRTGYPLYCGEFGAYHTAPLPLRLAWYRDMLALFEKHAIAWANWDYKGGFAPVVRDGEASEIADLLFQPG